MIKRGEFPVQFNEGRDRWYHDLMDQAEAWCEPEVMDSNDPLFILYTSGTTGKPKGIVHGTGGYLTGTYATTRWVFDLKDDDVFWCTADIGWITGHSYIDLRTAGRRRDAGDLRGRAGLADTRPLLEDLRGPRRVGLLHRAHGDPRVHEVGRRLAGQNTTSPDCGCSAPSASRSIPKPGPGTTSTSAATRCPIVDTWWQTETGQILITPLPGVTATKPGSATRAFPGISAEILDESGEPSPHRRRLSGA